MHVQDLSLLCGASMASARLDVEQEGQEAVEEARDQRGQLAHHAGRFLSRLAQRDQELGGQLPRAVLQLLRLGYLHGGHPMSATTRVL